jgi:hypothetical protein
MLSDRAKDLGISVDELKAQILAENGFSPVEDDDD